MKEQLISFETAKLAKEKGWIPDYLQVLLKRSSYDVSRYYHGEKFVRFYQYTPSKQRWLDKGETTALEVLEPFESHVLIETQMTSTDCIIQYSYKESDELPYYDCYDAPTQSLLQKWLREIHNIQIVVHPKEHSSLGLVYVVDVFYNDQVFNITYDGVYSAYKTYEEALEKGLQEALKLI